MKCQLQERNNAFYFIIQHISKTDAQVCVKNHNSDANNKDVITVDYMVTGGKQSSSICTQYKKKQSILKFENETSLTNKGKWHSNYIMNC